jgi:hypothetical protein
MALENGGRYFVVDYVNDPCDMRPQSKNFDGVPDTIIGLVVAGITNYLKKQFAPVDQPTDEDARWWP